MSVSVYDPYQPARRPRRRPAQEPLYRVLVHKRYRRHYEQLVSRVGLQQAQQFWDHLAVTPGEPSPVASITILRGKAGRPPGEGWSRTHHYEITSMARADYRYHDNYRTSEDGDRHRIVVILTINFSSH